MKLSAESLKAAVEALLYGELPSGDPRRQRRNDILNAASALFIRQGYRKTSVAEIARNAGVSKPTVYGHYTSKAHVLLHAVALEELGYLDRVAAVFDPSLSPSKRLLILIEQSLLLVRQMPLTSRLMGGERDIKIALAAAAEEQPPMQSGEGAPRLDTLQIDLYDALIEGVAPGRLSKTARRERAKILTTLAFCSPVLADEDLRHGVPYEQLVTQMAAMLVGGVGASDP